MRRELRATGRPCGPGCPDSEVLAPQDAVGSVIADECVERGQVVGGQLLVEVAAQSPQTHLGVAGGGGQARVRPPLIIVSCVDLRRDGGRRGLDP
ncbi:hypothetical protein NKH18_21200 [Streptomyces sp. M10(2022)]